MSLKEGVASGVGRSAVERASRQDRRPFQWLSGAQRSTRSLVRSGSAVTNRQRWLFDRSSCSRRTIRVSSSPGSARSRTAPSVAPLMK
ncbi:hypothetical protein [Streptomyces yunnanensis]|uniref:hypothetical protein n=1 Tax=Streptomyces yunnanensis TaxID=156453 RepID=UPI00142DBD8F